MSSTIATPPSSRPNIKQKTASINYEKYAPRTESQLNRLSRLASLTSGPTQKKDTASQQSPSQQQQHPSTSLLLAAMSPPPLTTPTSHPSSSTSLNKNSNNTNTLTPIQKTLLTSQLKTTHLQNLLTTSTLLSTSLSTALSLSTSLSQRHTNLLQHSTELSNAAERLQAEEAILSRHAEDIGAPLRHYDAIDSLGVVVGVLFKDAGGKTVVRGLAKTKVDGPDYVPTLDKIDAAIAFFPPGNDYARRAGVLRGAALDLWRDAVTTRIKSVTRDVYDVLKLGKEPIVADKLEASLVYTRFYGISSRSRQLLAIVRHRDGDAYRDLVLDARNTYCFSREKLLKNSVKVHMETLRGAHGLVGMTRLASVFLLRVCTSETNLYLEFFGNEKDEAEENGGGKSAVAEDGVDDDAKATEEAIELAAKAKMKKKNQVLLATSRVAFDDEIFQGMLSTLCSSFYRSVRRGLVMLNDLDTLCQIVSVLRGERAHANQSRVTVAASRAISGVIQDAQERLIFCANMSLQKEVVRFKAKPEDLDYPNRLLEGKSKKVATGDGSDALQAQLEVYEGWFPPMRSVLKILSKIFRVVEPRVFEDIAQQSVQACTKCLKEGSMHILMQSGVIHADLFLVKHLLILREQLSPFDINLRSIERQLDFSEASKAVTKFLANRNRQLFSMSTENALVTLLREGISVQESSVDSKRDLEDALRSACNDFIEHTFAKLIRPLLLFVEECKAATIAEVDLKQEEIVKADKVVGIMRQTNELFEPEMDNVTKEMAVYLENVATQSILLKPVVKKILRALEDARKFIGQVSEEGEGIGWTESVKSEVEELMKQLEVVVRGSGSKLVPR